jgi:hypothetical protein
MIIVNYRPMRSDWRKSIDQIRHACLVLSLSCLPRSLVEYPLNSALVLTVDNSGRIDGTSFRATTTVRSRWRRLDIGSLPAGLKFDELEAH